MKDHREILIGADRNKDMKLLAALMECNRADVVIVSDRDVAVNAVLQQKGLEYDGTPDIEVISEMPPIEKKQPKINSKTKAIMERRFRLR